MSRHAGGCHCGAVRFEVESDVDLVYRCNCSMCTKLGFLHLITDRQGFALRQGQDALTEYRFGTRVAAHLFCKHCGIESFYVPRSHPDGYSVNLRCLDDFELLQKTANIRDFDGQNWESNVDEIR